MPKSQKPRKRYRKEEHAQPPVVTQEQIDQIHSMTTDYELVTGGGLCRKDARRWITFAACATSST